MSGFAGDADLTVSPVYRSYCREFTENQLQMNRYGIVILLIFMAALSAVAGEVRTVGIPKDGTLMPVDSVFNTLPAAPKVTWIYPASQTFARDTITLYSDEAGKPLVIIETHQYPQGGMVLRDTLLIAETGRPIRLASAGWINGVKDDTRYKVRDDIDKPDWKLSPSVDVPLFTKGVVGYMPDSNGDWTRASVYYDDSSMDDRVFIERDISYELSPAEAQMIKHYAGMRATGESFRMNRTLLGIAILIIAIALAMFTMKADKVSHALRGKLAGRLVGPVAIVGYYMLVMDINSNSGLLPAILFTAAFLVAMSVYVPEIVIGLEDDRSLTNDEASNPFTITALMMLFAGWMTGAMLGGVWWVALLCAILFGLASFITVPDRGMRCEKCHRMGTMELVDDIEHGVEIKTHRHIHETYEEGVVESYRRHSEVYECYDCGHRTVMPERKSLVTRKMVRMPLWHSGAAKAPAKEPSRAEKALGNIDYKDPYLYDSCRMDLRDCTYHQSTSCRLNSESKPCSYSGSQCYCPYFSPSSVYANRVREKVRHDNTPIKAGWKK